MDIQAKIMAVLQSIDENIANVSPDTSLVQSGVIDSLTVLNIVNGLEEAFDFEFDDDELQIENFESIEKMETLIRAKVADAA